MLTLVLNLALLGAFATAGEIPCPQNGPVSSAQVRQILDTFEQSKSLAFETAMDLTLDCFENDGSKDFVSRVIVPTMRARLKKKLKNPMVKASGELATVNDMLRVDLIARMLIGEIASSSQCSAEEVSAVAKVALNRAKYAEVDRGRGWTRFVEDHKSKDLLLQVLMKPAQFQGLHDSRWASCPAKDIRQVFSDSSTGMDAYANTARAVLIAIEMVFDEDAFRLKTKNVDALYYAMGEKANRNWTSLRQDSGKPFYTELKGRRIRGKLIDNPDCIQLYRDLTLPQLKK